MKVIEKYDYDLNRNERLKGIEFFSGKGVDKSHGYSYLHAREEYKKMGQEMGFEKCVKSEERE